MIHFFKLELSFHSFGNFSKIEVKATPELEMFFTRVAALVFFVAGVFAGVLVVFFTG